MIPSNSVSERGLSSNSWHGSKVKYATKITQLGRPKIMMYGWIDGVKLKMTCYVLIMNFSWWNCEELGNFIQTSGFTGIEFEWWGIESECDLEVYRNWMDALAWEYEWNDSTLEFQFHSPVSHYKFNYNYRIWKPNLDSPTSTT